MRDRLRLAALGLLVAALVALVAWWPVSPAALAELRAHEADPPARAFWPAFVAVVGWIWNGVQAAGRISLAILSWSVKALWAFATATYHALKALGRVLALAGKNTWHFLRDVLGRAIVTGWHKLWRLVDRFRGWLEGAFRPVLEFLARVRARLLSFYTSWIRPVLDVIDIGRKVARVLGSLGVEWAKTLDRKLLEIQEAIDRPFRAVLAKVNEIIGLVNRVVTADGLFQRLALVRSIERDVKYVAQALAAARDKPLTAEQRKQTAKDQETKSPREAAEELRQYLVTGDGPRAPFINELAAQWRLSLSDRR